MPTGNVADFGNNEVFINPDGIANVLSLYLLGQKHHITYDSKDRGGVFKVHTSKVILEFKPTSTGLHVPISKNTPMRPMFLSLLPLHWMPIFISTLCATTLTASQRNKSNAPRRLVASC
jgi:hypothetical protein